MSYILSALKKAEHERHRGGIPDMLTSQPEGLRPQSAVGGAMLMPYWIGSVAILFLAGLWLLKEFYPDNNIVTIYSTVPLQSEPSADRPDLFLDASVRGRSDEAMSTGGDDPGASPGVSVPDVPASARDFAGDPVASQEARRDNFLSPSRGYADQILDIDELPPSLRGQLPRLVLSGHLYSLGHPTARKVILNGIALKEKQYLDDDLMIDEITPDGVVLDFQGRLFSLSASSMFR